jgi:hypothetical protein
MLAMALLSPLDSEKPWHFSRPAKSPFGDAGAGVNAAVPESAALGNALSRLAGTPASATHSKCQQLINA